ncbi:MAG: hypothetical protein ACOCQR_03885 [bacterium]
MIKQIMLSENSNGGWSYIIIPENIADTIKRKISDVLKQAQETGISVEEIDFEIIRKDVDKYNEGIDHVSPQMKELRLKKITDSDSPLEILKILFSNTYILSKKKKKQELFEILAEIEYNHWNNYVRYWMNKILKEVDAKFNEDSSVTVTMLKSNWWEIEQMLSRRKGIYEKLKEEDKETFREHVRSYWDLIN